MFNPGDFVVNRYNGKMYQVVGTSSEGTVLEYRKNGTTELLLSVDDTALMPENEASPDGITEATMQELRDAVYPSRFTLDEEAKIFASVQDAIMTGFAIGKASEAFRRDELDDNSDFVDELAILIADLCDECDAECCK